MSKRTTKKPTESDPKRRPMPTFDNRTSGIMTFVAASADGELFRIDTESGTIRPLRWEETR